IQALVRASAGVDVDYRAARLDLLSGASIDGLVVSSPPDFRAVAADFVRVGHVEARWSLGSIFGGRGPKGHGPALRLVAVSGLTVTVVVDEHGNTSLDGLASPGSARRPPPVPLSRRASSLLGTAPPVERVEIDDVTLVLIRTERGAASDRAQLSGLAIRLAARPAAPSPGGWRLAGGLGSAAAPLDVVLTRARADSEAATARAKLWTEVDATSSTLTVSLGVRMVAQTFAASVSAERWLLGEAAVRFHPDAGRTDVTLAHLEAADAAATVEGAVEIVDSGEWLVRRARGDVDVARLLRWLPPDLVPATAVTARVHCEVDGLSSGTPVRLAEGGAAVVQASVSDVVLGAPLLPLRIGAGELALRVQPARGGAVAASGSVKLGEAQLALGERAIALQDLTVDVDGRQDVDGALSGGVRARFARVQDVGPETVVARGGEVELRALELHPDAPPATRGDLALSIGVASFDWRRHGARAIVDGATVRARSVLEGQAPYAFAIEAPFSRVRVSGPDGRVLLDAPGRAGADARDVRPDFARLQATAGTVHATAQLGDAQATVDVTKAADAVDFSARVAARTLEAIRPLLPATLADRAPWERMAVAVRSTGHVEGLAAARPYLRQATDVEVDRPAFDGVAARSVHLGVHSEGTARRHRFDVDVRAQGLAVGGGEPSDDHVELSAAADLERPSLRFELATSGRAAATLSGSLSFDPLRRTVPYAFEGRLSGLAPLAPLIATPRGAEGFDVSRLEIRLSSSGSLLGVVAAVGRDGTIALEPNPARTAAIDGTTDLWVSHFRWTRGDTAITAPAVAWHGQMHALDGRRTLDSRVEVGALRLDLGSREMDLDGIGDVASASITGTLLDPEVTVSERLSVRGVEQAVVPEYPIGDVELALEAERSPEGALHVSDLTVTNRAAGTSVALSGNVDLGDGRRTLSMTGSLTQDLARVWKDPERFEGRGSLAIEANVTSPDLAHFRVRGAVKGQDVSVRLPRAGVDVESANGEVPVALALQVAGGGAVLERSDKRSPYAALRFADQHPLLSRSSFISVARVDTPLLSVAPLVGNLEIDQNVISLQQFEMGMRGGRVTGQCDIDWDGPRSTVELHVRATGVQSSHGEPFDGNIAVAISAADRMIDGRAEILRIGERHLLDLLDLQDPLHRDPATNRVRTALAFGYPKMVRLVFDHGFASAHLELGGLARLVSIGELRGIPMGPIFDKMLAPVLDARRAQEGP
ncbi:MAG TPA: hypothetical protein VE987_11415, partial [Polyangiaceae bacterium]|nr:hypothetical protein [Polyangiaceae bacterium]